jgi:hypothetical protein
VAGSLWIEFPGTECMIGRLDFLLTIPALIVIICLFMSGIFFVDYLHTRPDPAWPLLTGTVIARQRVKVYMIANRTKLSIQSDGNGPIVHSILLMNGSTDIPDRVSFRYGGDPKREVVLFEETSSLIGALIFLGLSLFFIAFFSKDIFSRKTYF